jgi:hypothetical protein
MAIGDAMEWKAGFGIAWTAIRASISPDQRHTQKKPKAMGRQASEIEVEVVEVENKPPGPPRGSVVADTPGNPDWGNWRDWHGRVPRAYFRWWPLWMIPGLILFVLLAALALAVGLLVVISLGIRRMLRAFFR